MFPCSRNDNGVGRWFQLLCPFQTPKHYLCDYLMPDSVHCGGRRVSTKLKHYPILQRIYRLVGEKKYIKRPFECNIAKCWDRSSQVSSEAHLRALSLPGQFREAFSENRHLKGFWTEETVWTENGTWNHKVSAGNHKDRSLGAACKYNKGPSLQQILDLQIFLAKRYTHTHIDLVNICECKHRTRDCTKLWELLMNKTQYLSSRGFHSIGDEQVKASAVTMESLYEYSDAALNLVLEGQVRYPWRKWHLRWEMMDA